VSRSPRLKRATGSRTGTGNRRRATISEPAAASTTRQASVLSTRNSSLQTSRFSLTRLFANILCAAASTCEQSATARDQTSVQGPKAAYADRSTSIIRPGVCRDVRPILTMPEWDWLASTYIQPGVRAPLMSVPQAGYRHRRP
jgi:hypothetical protein